MKFSHILFTILICIFFPIKIIAQIDLATESLKTKYSRVQYNKECGGWYFLSYQKDGQTLYGFADVNGNVVASDASKYELFPGYIKLYLIDEAQKSKHDQWIIDMRQYNTDYTEYQRIKAKHENEIAAYNAKVRAAKNEAQNIYNQQRQAAINAAKRRQAAQQQSQKNTSIFGAILGGVNNALEITNAANSVQYEPILNQVLANRGLTVPPSAPYNPEPTKPVEPSSGYYWASYPLRQPSNYSNINFNQISDGTGFADVAENGKWGLVDAYFNEIIPCTNNSKVYSNSFNKNRHKIYINGKYGVIDSKGQFILQAQYNSIEQEGSNFIVQIGGKKGILDNNGQEITPCQFDFIEKSNGYLLCCIAGKWGCYTSDFQELYPCQFQKIRFEKINNKLVLLTQQRGLWGTVDFQTGKDILPNKYSDIKKFSLYNKEVLSVSKNGKYGLYTLSGVLLLPCEYSFISVTKIGLENILFVKKGNASGYYNLNGIPIISEDHGFDNIDYKGNYFIDKKNGKMGVCSSYGEILINCEYASLYYDNNLRGFIAEKKDNYNISQYGVLSIIGQEMVPFTHNKISYKKGNNYFDIGYYKNYGAIDFEGNIIAEKCKHSSDVPKKVAKYIKKNKKNNKADINESYLRVTEMMNVAINNYIKKIDEIAKERATFSYYAQNYVERIINDWQCRGEFEKAESYKQRVNNETRKQKIYTLTKDAQDQYIKIHEQGLKPDNIYIIGDYDTEHEVYRIRSSYAGKDILVPVNIDDASEFKTNFNSIKKKPTFFIENDHVSVPEYSFTMPNGNVYKYNNKASLTYSIAQVEYKFDDITLDGNIANNNYQGGKQTFSTTSITLGTSDVDVMIPQTDITRENVFAIIIANENYEREKNVEFAYNDGMIFKDYCIKTLGVPSENVHFHPNATLNDMRFAINWIKDVSKAYNGKARFILYYAGHGVPDDGQKDAYLLPIDGFSSDFSTGYKLSSLYETLGNISAEKVTVFLDACFSGAQRNGEIMASTRGVAIRTHIEKPKGNVVIFSAASNSETAHPYKEKSHGLFTYFLLKKLQSERGNVNLGDLIDYIKTEVPKVSIRINKKTQTPTVSTSDNIINSWRESNI